MMNDELRKAFSLIHHSSFIISLPCSSSSASDILAFPIYLNHRRTSSLMKRLGVGFIGSGFVSLFHIRSWIGVRDADVRGVWSPTRAHAESAAQLARNLRVGQAQAFN